MRLSFSASIFLLALTPLTLALNTGLGINCEGSGRCSKNGAVGQLSKLIDSIDPCRVYPNKAHVACWKQICVFLQGTQKGLSGLAIQALMREIVIHGCDGCGSVPIGFPTQFAGNNDPSKGILTVNWVSDQDSPCPDGVC
jgi:hypothetical protein